MPPVIHHVEICARDAKATVKRLKKFGFKCFAKKDTPICSQIVLKLGAGVFFVVSERKNVAINHRNGDPLVILCCEEKVTHEVDTVFNVVFTVKNVKNMVQRIQNAGGTVIEAPNIINDANGEIEFAIIKSICGNVVHTLLNKDNFNGPFLVGFEPMDDETSLERSMQIKSNITHIDHVTLAVHPGQSPEVLKFYEAWGMTRFSISKDDTEEDGLILADGVGLRLRAMEYWRCAETGLSFAADKKRNPNSVMLVVVESLLGQINCNIERFLSEHRGPGIEHLAFNAPHMTHTVKTLLSAGVKFRKPPLAYYDELQKTKQISDLGEDLSTLKKLGILLDNENSSEADKRYLMQIFAEPLFEQKTFFIELIKRVNNARGLGSGNVIALVKSIREEERRKVAETKIKEEESTSNPRRLC